MPPGGSKEPKSLTRADFDNPDVLNAVNPHPRYGYFHGPIHDVNPGWKPKAWIDRNGGPGQWKPVSCRDVDKEYHTPTGPANEMALLSRAHSLTCSVLATEIPLLKGQDISGLNIMCGTTCKTLESLRKHIRNIHTGAIITSFSRKQVEGEFQAGENALKKLVLTGGWRQARFMYEPNYGEGKIREYCDALEKIAADDQDFASKYGRSFHRDIVRQIEAGKKSLKHGPWSRYQGDQKESGGLVLVKETSGKTMENPEIWSSSSEALVTSRTGIPRSISSPSVVHTSMIPPMDSLVPPVTVPRAMPRTISCPSVAAPMTMAAPPLPFSVPGARHSRSVSYPTKPPFMPVPAEVSPIPPVVPMALGPGMCRMPRSASAPNVARATRPLPASAPVTPRKARSRAQSLTTPPYRASPRIARTRAQGPVLSKAGEYITSLMAGKTPSHYTDMIALGTNLSAVPEHPSVESPQGAADQAMPDPFSHSFGGDDVFMEVLKGPGDQTVPAPAGNYVVSALDDEDAFMKSLMETGIQPVTATAGNDVFTDTSNEGTDQPMSARMKDDAFWKTLMETDNLPVPAGHYVLMNTPNETGSLPVPSNIDDDLSLNTSKEINDRPLPAPVGQNIFMNTPKEADCLPIPPTVDCNVSIPPMNWHDTQQKKTSNKRADQSDNLLNPAAVIQGNHSVVIGSGDPSRIVRSSTQSGQSVSHHEIPLPGHWPPLSTHSNFPEPSLDHRAGKSDSQLIAASVLENAPDSQFDVLEPNQNKLGPTGPCGKTHTYTSSDGIPTSTRNIAPHSPDAGGPDFDSEIEALLFTDPLEGNEMLHYGDTTEEDNFEHDGLFNRFDPAVSASEKQPNLRASETDH
ncbi:hypothetical protein N7532_001917 [Penicillium argentinense]|uniref:Uncharacterized protein n=1 Tax=Penicillium argentinense TaxID=1131581 RepID=A0A9W9G502_9EURO|nr:uncharacterized protein N7532_001917 [Penicillium argentinense]KAJ5111382.1 hypothetical protein N7532_001917 [Penicillium argentinense]